MWRRQIMPYYTATTANILLACWKRLFKKLSNNVSKYMVQRSTHHDIWFIPRGCWYGLITWMPLLISLSKIEDGSNTNWYLTQQFDDFVSSTQTALRTPNNSPSRIGDRLYNEYRSSMIEVSYSDMETALNTLLPVGLFIMSMEFPSISTYRLAKRLLKALIPKIRSTMLITLTSNMNLFSVSSPKSLPISIYVGFTNPICTSQISPLSRKWSSEIYALLWTMALYLK